MYGKFDRTYPDSRYDPDHKSYSRYLENNSVRDTRQGVVVDPPCYPRKRNTHTGFCKAPCENGYAVNPRTGACVTKDYLRSLNYNDYDTDDDDLMLGAILSTPTGFSSNLHAESVITVKDTAVMRGIMQGAGGFSFSGTYDGPKRKKICDEGTTDRDAWGECGIKVMQEAGLDWTKLRHVPCGRQQFVWPTFLFCALSLDNAIEASKHSKIRVLFLTVKIIRRVVIPQTSRWTDERTENIENIKRET